MAKDPKKPGGFQKPNQDNQTGEIKSREVFERLLTACSKGKEEVYQLLEQYQEKITDNFARMVREEAEMQLRRRSGRQKNIWLNKLWNLNIHIYEFPKGNRASQIEIAITICEVLIKFVTCKAFPSLWASLQIDLGVRYGNRIRGDLSENPDLAIAAYQNALKIYTREAFPEKWATIQNNLGAVYDDQEKFDLAIATYQNALEISTRKAFPEDWAMTQNNLGVVYSDQEEFDLAITAYQNALGIYTRESVPESWAMTQNNLGYAYREAGDIEQSIGCYSKALEVWTREEIPEDWALTQHNLGNAYSDLGQIEEALVHFQLSLEVFQATAFPSRRLQAGRDFGDAAFAAGRWHEAIEGYTAGIEAVEVSCSWASSNQHRSEILHKAIDVYTQTVQACLNNHQPELALEYVERSKARNLVQLFADSDNKSNQVNSNVLKRLDKLKQQILGKQQELDNIGEDSGKQTKSIVSNIVEELFAEFNDAEFTNQPTSEEQGDQVASDDAANLNQLYARQLRANLENLQQQFDLVLEEIIQLDPAYALTHAVQPIRYQEIIDQLGDRTAIIEWYLTEKGFYTFLITSHSQQPEVWQFSPEEQEELNQWQQEYLSDYNQHKYYRWSNVLESRLEKLAEILRLKSILDKVPPNCDQLILVPHRYLHLLPLHALPINSDTDECLLNRFSEGVRYAPSCQLLQLSQKRSLADAQQEINKDLFAIQNPTEDLNFADVEVKTISQYFDRNYVLPRQEATKSKWKKRKTQNELKLANFVHFSCHSYFNSAAPLSSPLVLSAAKVESTSAQTTEPWRFIQSPEQQSYDLQKCLLLKEIFTLDLLPCRLVTLSACETGLSNSESWGDEYIGLPSGFLVAGTPSVVGSQWAVSDISTAILMIKFYENLMAQFDAEQLSVPKALNSAQLWLRSVTKTDLLQWLQQFNLDQARQKELERDLKLAAKEQPYAQPIYWAAFCAIGQ